MTREEKAPEISPCPLCNKPMQEGRAGMWLHYLEEGCDFVAALRQIQKFFDPLLSMDAWKDIGAHPPGPNPGKASVGEGTLRLHIAYNAGPTPWDTVRRVLLGVQIDAPGSACGCESCRIIIQASERQQIRKHPWRESPRQWGESLTAEPMKMMDALIRKSDLSILGTITDRGKPLPDSADSLRWLTKPIPIKPNRAARVKTEVIT